jgi:hypothetical protein
VPIVIALCVISGCSVVPPAAAPSATPRSGAVPFDDVAQTANGNYDGGPALIVGTTDAAESAIIRSVPGVTKRPGRVLLIAMQGSQRTAGFAIRIDKVERDADRLLVRATFITPAPGAITAQVLTAPAHVIAIAPNELTGLHEAILFDDAGVERARTTVP